MTGIPLYTVVLTGFEMILAAVNTNILASTLHSTINKIILHDLIILLEGISDVYYII